MYGAGLSPYLRDSTYFFQADGQKNLEQDPALREKRDPEVAERCKGVANTLHKNRKALFLLFPLDRTVERAKSESSASLETMPLPPAMFRVIGFIILVRLSLTEYQHIECQWSSERPIYEGKNEDDRDFGCRKCCENSRILREFAKT